MYSESQHRFNGLAGWKQAVMTSVYFLSPVLGPLMAGLNEKQQSPSCRPPSLHWGLQGSLNNGTCVPPTASSTRVSARDWCCVTNSESLPPENTGWAPAQKHPSACEIRPPPPEPRLKEGIPPFPWGTRRGDSNTARKTQHTSLPPTASSVRRPSCALARGLANMRAQ